MLKEVVVLGGPNGAGKTTASRILLPAKLGLREFVNADEIARGLLPFNAEAQALAAGRLMIERMHFLAAQGTSFAFETTCSGRGHAEFLKKCKAEGCYITLYYLWLRSADASLARVRRRAKEGGHDIPPEIIQRRYLAGLRNMWRLYLPPADTGAIYDNTEGKLSLIAESRLDCLWPSPMQQAGPQSRA